MLSLRLRAPPSPVAPFHRKTQNNGGKSIVECRHEKVILDIYCNSCVAENGMLEEGEAMELIEQRGES